LSPEALDALRERAVAAILGGMSQTEVARVFNLNRVTVSGWWGAYRSGGPAALLSRTRGRKPRQLLTPDQAERLRRAVAEHRPDEFGLPFTLWTQRSVGVWAERELGIRRSQWVWGRWLRANNFSPQKPVCQDWERDDEAIESWVRDYFPAVVEEARAQGAYIVFVDETGFKLEPHVRRTYAPRGKTPVLRVAEPHDRISVIGAITVSPSRHRVGLVYQMLADNANYRGGSIVRFVEDVRAHLAAPMIVVWDRIPIHSCVAVEDYLATATEVTAEPFPPYAPEINPADGVWRYIKHIRLANYTPPSLEVLRGTVTAELDRLRKRKDLLASFIRFTRLPIEVPGPRRQGASNEDDRELRDRHPS
jgi:transposase